MAHENLDNLLEYLKDKTVDQCLKWDFREKSAFLSRVSAAVEYKAQEELQSVLDVIEHEPGLKMCFRVTRDDTGTWMNVPNDTFARKLAFFTSRTVITFPFHEVSHSHGADFEALLQLLFTTRPFLKEGLITIIPSDNHNPILLRTLKKLMPANFQIDKLEIQFEEKKYKTHIDNVYQPHFDQISSEDIISIRQEEKKQYARLEDRLEQDVMSGGFDEQRLLDELRLINQYVCQLDALAREINDAITRNSLSRLIYLAAATGAGFLLAPSIAIPAAGVLGTPKLYSIFQDVLTEKAKMREKKKDDFYLFWKINHTGSIVALRRLLASYLEKLRQD